MPAFPIPSYSHSGEDRLIWKLFGYARGGTYVDVGCYHPADYSNTYLLYCAGWRGLAIDADDHFLALYATMRPEDKVRNVGISVAPGTATLFTFDDRSLNTFDPSIAAEREAADPARWLGEIAVPVKRLDQLLAEEAIGHFDFLNIDVEGRDLAVLQSNDWQRWKPRIIAVEDHEMDLSRVDRSATYQFLAATGYALQSQCNYTSVYCLR